MKWSWDTVRKHKEINMIGAMIYFHCRYFFLAGSSTRSHRKRKSLLEIIIEVHYNFAELVSDEFNH